MNALDTALFIVGLAAIIAAAYFVTYLVGARSFRVKSAREIKLLDRFALSKDKAFYLARVKGKVYFIAMTNQSAELLDTFDGSEFDAEEPTRMTFKEALASSAAGAAPRWLAGALSKAAGAGRVRGGGGTADDTKKNGEEDTR
ncbi:MAG: flagellar biosynthetic protein FliO [Oscillospiraceae bacterium]|jgi:flagellar biogenesis protein FliO|nr:flagellar biosynthetic protein FliO [Oscillospiraceae bacterium]